MPWVWIIVVIVSAYVLVKAVQGMRDFISWWSEGRQFAKEWKRTGQRHRSGPPMLKERPESSQSGSRLGPRRTDSRRK